MSPRPAETTLVSGGGSCSQLEQVAPCPSSTLDPEVERNHRCCISPPLGSIEPYLASCFPSVEGGRATLLVSREMGN